MTTVRAAEAVTLEAASARYGGRPALESTTCSFASGTTVALVGPNGAGKTTLLRLLAGLLAPSEGTVSRPADWRVAMVAQHQQQHRWMPLSVAEVLAMSRFSRRGLLRPMRAADRTAVAEAAERMDVGVLGGRSFGELSGGQRQRVLIASALAAQAEILLLDEPVTGLDPPSQARILAAVAEERDAGALVVVSTHDLEEARRCDRVLLLAGRVVADGAPEATLTRANLAAAFGSHLLQDDPGPVVLDEHGHGSHH